MSTNLGWDIVVELSILCAFLLFGSFLRSRVRFFQRFLVPVALIGGFMAMLANESFLGKLTGIYIPFDENRLGIYVYHLLSVTFIAMAFRGRGGAKGRDAVAMGIGSSTLYALQGFVGIGLGLVLMYTFYPDLFPTFGALAPLGFGQGPGLTYSIARTWEESFNFAHAGNLGLTMAALGYFWACFLGVPIVNIGIKKGWCTLVKDKSHLSDDVYKGVFSRESTRPEAGRLTTTSEAVESFAFHGALIGMMFLITFLIMKVVVALLLKVGAAGFVSTLEGFYFIFATLLTLLMRKIMEKAKLDHIVDDGIMSRIAGFSVDFLVIAAIAAISLGVVMQFIAPILITSLAVGLITLFFCFWYAKRSFKTYHFERAIAIYGMLTGTINTGLILLRMVDPEYNTPVAQDLVFTSAISLPLCFPLLLFVNWPLKGVEVTGDTWLTANPSFYWQTLLAIGLMYVILLIVYRATGLVRLRRPWLKLWPEAESE
jgi:ESS family glutamate:Na+ symporter